jgi:hexosaminidase
MKDISWSTLLLPTMFAILVPSPMFAQKALGNAPFVNNLLPQPARVAVAEGRFVLTAQFSIATTGFDNSRLDEAIGRTIQQLRQRTGFPLAQGTSHANREASMTIAVKGGGEEIQSIDEDESYTLSVKPSGVQIEAPTVVGAMRALQTLLQLVQPAGGDYTLPVVSIEDSPRFRWRGLMVDCGRHFEPVSELKRTLDGMAAVKLNVFHWHLTEDQGFRMESKLYPKLTAMGSDGLFYTQQDAEEVVRYARARGIRVVPEFEMPGHSTAWLLAYPELASGRAPNVIRREFGISDFALDPTNEQTYQFLQRFLGEMARIFPDPYVHIGGDETKAPEWKSDPKIQAFMQAHQLHDSDALQAYFNQRVLVILKTLHKHMVGWDEILNPGLPKDVVVQSWRGEASLVKGAQQGYQGVLSAGYYLDAMRSAAEHYGVDPLPSATNLSPEQRRLVLGGEICLFGEHVNERSIDSRLWPRSAAIAERLWSPEQVTDVDDMYRRLNVTSLELEALGLHHLSQEDASLRELAGTQNIDDLRRFSSVLEPVSFHERYEQQKTSQLTVLNQFVDAVRPDPPSRYELERLTRNFLKAPTTDIEDQEALNGWFKTMEASVPAVKLQIQQTPLLADIEVRAEQLPELARAGVEAVSLLSSGRKAPSGWKSKRLAEIEAAKRPSGIVRFTFIDSLTALVSSVQE